MATNKRKIEITIAGDAKGLERAFGAARGAAGKFGSAMKTAAKAAGLAVGAAAAGAVVLGKQAIDAASNLDESLSKVNVVFAEQAAEIESWSKRSAKAFGQSQAQALEAAGTYGNLFQAFGIGREESTKMSKSLVELAADLASFNNTSVDDALQALQSGVSGETEPLKRYGVAINDVRLKEQALRLGLIKTTKDALTPGAKAQAAYALIMQDTTLAQGDFARTSDGLANKQRIAAAQFENLKATIGKALLPVMSSLMGFVSSTVIPKLSELAERWMPTLVRAFERVREVAAQAVTWFRANWPQIQQVISQVIVTIRGVIEGFVTTATTLWNNFGNNILEFVQRVWPAVQQVIGGALEVIRGIIQTVTSLIQGDWSGVWEGIKSIFSGAWSAIQGLVKMAFEQLRLAVGVGLEIVGSMIKGAWDGIVDFVTGLPGRISGAAAGMFDGIKNAFKAAINWIIRAWNGLEFGIPGFDPPGPGPTFPGFTLGVPDIPEMRAMGGGVKGGKPYWVGELGRPELFVPQQSGSIVPDFAMGGGNTYVFPSFVGARSELAAELDWHDRRRRLSPAGVR